MKIIIAGAGEVGFHLAKLLSFESQDITLIDNDRESLMYADTHLDIRTLKGDATSIAVLKDAQVKKVDLVIAVTSSETTNITVCVLAKQLGAKKTIARIANTEFLENKEEIGFDQFGIDELISPEALAAHEIELLLNQSAFNDTYEFEGGALTMMGLTLLKSAAFVGKTVKETARIFPRLHFMPIAVQRQGSDETIIPRGNTQLREGDQVYFITTEGGVADLYKLTGKVRQEMKNVMILGGSKIGRKTTRDLCDKKMNVKLIESDKETAFDLADELPKVVMSSFSRRRISRIWMPLSRFPGTPRPIL